MINSRPKSYEFDYYILVPMFILWLFGVVAVFTSSNQIALAKHGGAFFFVKNHLKFSLIGFGFFILAARFRMDLLKDSQGARLPVSYVLLILAAFLLILVLIPGIGHKAGNARRWLNLIFIKFQPSEFLKLALCIFFANYLVRFHRDIKKITHGFLFPMVILSPFLILLLLQPDLGSVVIIGMWLCGLLVVAGINLIYPSVIGMAALCLGSLFVLKKGYNLDRILTFLDPWKDPLGKGFQPIHSMYAFALGGITGRGPGESIQKLFYLPEPHTDYILSVVAEEFGFIAVLVIAVCYAMIIFRGIALSCTLTDKFKKYLAWGITSIFAMQVIINMGVVTGLLPSKGLTLPFISYGGSSLVFTFISLGLLFNLSARRETLSGSREQVFGIFGVVGR